MPTNHWKS